MKLPLTRIGALLIAAMVSAPAEIVTRELTYKAGDTSLKGFLAFDEAKEGKVPGILVVHEWWGHNQYARQRARMLAELGYVAFAVDMYGEGKQAAHPEDAGKFSKAVMQDMESATARFNAALEILKQQPQTDPERIAAIGYCFGGAIVLNMARAGLDLDGVVSFHGSLDGKQSARPRGIKARILVCHGADDKFISAQQIENFKEEMKKAGANYQFNAYPGALHSFTNPEADNYGKEFNLPLAYHRKADQTSWADMQGFFDEIFR